MPNTPVLYFVSKPILEYPMSQRLKILNIVGARPNLPKIAPLMREMQRHPEIEPILVHTGQHYDDKLSDIFFRQMGIPEPDVNLEVGSGSHASQTAEILKRIEPVLLDRKPDLVLVVGDLNSTIAVSLAAVKLEAVAQPIFGPIESMSYLGCAIGSRHSRRSRRSGPPQF